MDETPIEDKNSIEEQLPPPRSRVRDLYSWKALNRPAKQYSKEVFTTFGAITLLVSIILAFIQEWFAIIVAWAALWLFYMLSKIPPEEVEYKITSEGLIYLGRSDSKTLLSAPRTYLWSEIGPFWFTSNKEGTVLHIAHRNIFDHQALVINPADQEKIRDILADYIPYIEVPQKSMVEKLMDWFSEKFPIESKPKTTPEPTQVIHSPPVPPPQSTTMGS